MIFLMLSYWFGFSKSYIQIMSQLTISKGVVLVTLEAEPYLKRMNGRFTHIHENEPSRKVWVSYITEKMTFPQLQ